MFYAFNAMGTANVIDINVYMKPTSSLTHHSTSTVDVVYAYEVQTTLCHAIRGGIHALSPHLDPNIIIAISALILPSQDRSREVSKLCDITSNCTHALTQMMNTQTSTRADCFVFTTSGPVSYALHEHLAEYV